PSAEEAKRYGLIGKPACLVFDHGKEVARVTNIADAGQLATFIDGALAKLGLAFTSRVETAAEKPSAKFPSLEDQKLADQAWKRLGLELEPIRDEDLKRVKALGYDGGLKVVGGHGDM